MKETDYRDVENALAETLRVFLASKQKLTAFERSFRDSLIATLGDVVKRRTRHGAPVQNAFHEGR